MMCERAGEVTAQTRSKSLQLGAIFRVYSKVCTYLLYLSKQLYNPQHLGNSRGLVFGLMVGGRHRFDDDCMRLNWGSELMMNRIKNARRSRGLVLGLLVGRTLRFH